ncbi:hypothetical protein HMPREF0758_2950 [Serratia odorifera DSM 4582]|jgi:hypothetical protein|uniref:Uncharacterized protein n=1 Tax=Serratia odorifera DSM 4582 TaxID=667129 RepID=D4E450_SEROD|nr:hypothetical protein HMPREF0758_2950 [Serratia odorifera DSM 4582]
MRGSPPVLPPLLPTATRSTPPNRDDEESLSFMLTLINKIKT